MLYEKWKKQAPLLQHAGVISFSCKRLHQFAAVTVEMTTAYVLTEVASSPFPFAAGHDLPTVISSV